MSERCEMTDLPIDQCAGKCCRPDLKPDPPEQVHVRVQFMAQYDSRCDLCDERIRTGEPMGFGLADARICKRHLS